MQQRRSLKPTRSSRAKLGPAVFLGLLALGGAVAFRARRQLLAKTLKLPPATNEVAIERELPIPLPDGITTLADHYVPLGVADAPTIVIRTPYGRAFERSALSVLIDVACSLFAERGYHVLLQGVRGRFRSGGRFEPFIHEGDDGRATFAWLAAQSWFSGVAGMWGPSYLGYTQWALASDPPPGLYALMPLISSSRFSRLFYPIDGLFCLESSLRWVSLVAADEDGDARLPLFREARIRRGLEHVPISEADRVVAGRPMTFYQTWLHNRSHRDPYWQAVDHYQKISKIDLPMHLVGGWYDIFLRDQLVDYAALVAAGRMPYLTIGEQTHSDLSHGVEGLREGLAWFDAHLKGQAERLRQRAVRLFVMGADEWHEMDYWPPPAELQRWFLRPDGTLGAEPTPGSTAPSCYEYRPSNPTPMIGGPLLLTPRAGRHEQGEIELRPDVLIFTSAPLALDLDVIGHVRLELFVRSSLEHSDFVGRLCEVLPDGRSFNVCDGIFRVGPDYGELQPDGTRKISIDLWATAQRFKAGHRIRLHVCSGGHPRWSRNLGTGEDFGLPDPAIVAQQSIYHDAEHPSALFLPVVIANRLK